MTIDEHIAKAEQDAKQAEFDTEWGIGNYFINRTEALEYAKECRQLAEWLKDYKRVKEKEEPKMVIYSGDGYADGELVYDMAECPNCGAVFEEDEYGFQNDNYCSHCGQALKWEVDE